jgi:fructose-bisphosphate aldolase/6-deoxy-5-ketofructose 1-phosphate synthase
MLKITSKEIKVPADVPKNMEKTYVKNFLTATKNTGRLMLFAGDQKIEHLNDDFYGKNSSGNIAAEDADPEHLFRIASKGTIGAFASQLGLIARYGRTYPKIPYIIKMNSKTHLVNVDQAEPRSYALVDYEDVIDFKKNSKLNIIGVGYTIYVGSEYESEMLAEAGRLVTWAHQNGMLTILWMYPRGKAVIDEKDPHLIAGAAGIAACLGSDFAKVNYPKKDGMDAKTRAESFKEAIKAAGRTRVITAGGSSKDAKAFLQETYDQIHISGCMGNATGRNIHQRPLDEAVRLCDAISAVTLGDKDVEFANDVYLGKKKFKV